MNADKEETEIALLKKAALDIQEHFDTVQIFVTRKQGEKVDETLRIATGEGNWYARYGQIREWLIQQDEIARVSARKKAAEAE